MIGIFHSFISHIDRLFFYKPKLNWIQTVYFNFRVLPLKQAIKLPIYLYGNWCFKALKGSIFISASKIHKGMFKFGYDFASYFTASISNISLHYGSKFILHEGIKVGQGVQITLYPNALFEMQAYSTLGDNVTVICSNSIKIGSHSGITWNCQLMDTNSHYIEDLNSKKIKNIIGRIVIGDYCWICNNTSIMANSELPNRIIVASRSIVNKNYKKIGLHEYALIGGTPAKLLKNNVKRIYDCEIEKELNVYFKNNSADFLLKDTFCE